jgi:hypothetical protein
LLWLPLVIVGARRIAAVKMADATDCNRGTSAQS